MFGYYGNPGGASVIPNLSFYEGVLPMASTAPNPNSSVPKRPGKMKYSIRELLFDFFQLCQTTRESAVRRKEDCQDIP